MIPLPIDGHIDVILGAVRRARAAIVTAAPGAGKTTRVPPALAVDGPVILLQPRRMAARAIAARIADERGWTLGREVGWQVRFERRFGGDTRLLVVTEGILTARLQTDPLLSEFHTIVVDEFHERSIHGDLALALARQACLARGDLRIVVMSATLESTPVSAFLGDCPIVDVPGRSHPLEIAYLPGSSVGDAVHDVVQKTAGNVLCFLPGAPEIHRAINQLEGRLPAGVDLLPLHGSLDADAQDLALRSSARRRVIVATNIAETSLTVPGVTSVVDTGLHKVARYDSERGVDSLETERVTLDAADQRAGRAGRMGPGAVRRLWDPRDRLRPHREPEVHRVDLSSAALDIVAWGGNPRTFEWFERPRDHALVSALDLLARLMLVDAGGRLTAIGEQVRRMPLHPRLARMLVAAGGSRDMARACAILSERNFLPPRTATTTSDLLSAIDSWDAAPPQVKRAAEIIQSINKSEICTPNSELRETEFRRALLSGYPDRVARRREPGSPGSPNVLLASGTGATIAPESGVRDGEFLITLDIHAGVARGVQPRDCGPERAALQPLVRIASVIERDWLVPTSTDVEHRFDAASGTVKARRVERYDALVLAEHPVPVDADIAAQLLADAWIERGPGAEDQQLLRRLRFSGHDVELASLVRLAAQGARRLGEIDLARALPPATLHELDRNAPETLLVPSGRRARLEYGEDGTVSASAKLQELFGLAETPRVGLDRVPVLLSLLAPNGRPVQITRDLRSFWDRTYPEVRKELRGRYPKHPWPDDPWTAIPTARTKRSVKLPK